MKPNIHKTLIYQFIAKPCNSKHTFWIKFVYIIEYKFVHNNKIYVPAQVCQYTA